MQYYWYGIIAIISLAFFRKEFAYLYIPFFAVLLLYLPDTGLDYSHYQHNYMSGSFHTDWPFFRTDSGLTSEPLYRAYSAFIRVVTGFSFPQFLGLNFLISMGLIFTAWRRIFGSRTYFPLFLLYFSVVAAPTIFYFSPRSSISFALICLAFGFMKQQKIWWASFAAFLTISIHSQYIVAIFMLYIVYFADKMNWLGRQSPKVVGFAIGGGIFLGLVFSTTLLPTFLSLFSFLPSIDLLQAKSRYLTAESRGGLRLASAFSLLLYPALLFFATRFNFEKVNIHDRRSIIYISAIVFTNMGIVIWGISDAHLSGRIARFTDYFAFSALLPLFFVAYSNRFFAIVPCLLLALASPTIFTGLYNF